MVDVMRRVAAIVGGAGAILGACLVSADLVPSVLLTWGGPDADLAVFAVVSQSASLVLCLLGAVGGRRAVSGGAKSGAFLMLVSAFGPVISVLSYLSLLPRIPMIPGFDTVYPGPLSYVLACAPVLASLIASGLLFSDRRSV